MAQATEVVEGAGRGAWLQRALAWSLVAGALLAQGFLLVRFAGDAMAAYITDPARYDGRWWHGSEPLFAFAGYAMVLVAGALLARTWTRVARPPAQAPPPADAAPADGDDAPEVTIDVPAFLRPKTRLRRPGAGALAGLSFLGALLAVGGIVLGVVEALQMYEVLRRNAGEPAALGMNSTVWIRRLMEVVAPALQFLGAAVVGLAWTAYWPLPPAEEVVEGPRGGPPAASGTTQWNRFD